MNEEKRVDVNSIKDLEKRVDVLEGQPETPLVCPIFKTDLDNLNDRITVLEGGTPSEVKNPMQFTELDDFEGRVEELEGGGEETVKFKAGDTLKINLKNIADYLGTAVPEELLYKEVEACSSGQTPAAISIEGPNNITIGCAYDFDGATCYIDCSTISSQISQPIINWTCTAFSNSLGDALEILETNEIAYDELLINKDFEIYKKPHVTIGFLDGTTEEIISTEDIEIFKKEEPVPPVPPTPAETNSYYADTEYFINELMFSTMYTELSSAAKEKEAPNPSESSGTIKPVFIFLGPDTEYSTTAGDYVLSGSNAFGVTFDCSTGDIYGFTDVKHGLLTSKHYLGNIMGFNPSCASTIGNVLQLIAENGIGSHSFTLDADFEVFTPAKVVTIGYASGAYTPGNYVTCDLISKPALLSSTESS